MNLFTSSRPHRKDMRDIIQSLTFILYMHIIRINMEGKANIR